MSRRDKFISIEEKEEEQRESDFLESIKEAKAEAKRLAKNERARERRAAKKAGLMLCTVKWVKNADLWQYTNVPSVFDIVSSEHAAYCYHHETPMQKTPRLVHSGGDEGNCVCLNCKKGLVWRPCCMQCNFQNFI